MQQLITARQVLPGPTGQRIIDGGVLIDGDTITATGPRRDVEPRAAADAVHRNYPRHTLLPGLIDAHVHLAFDADTTPLEHLSHVDDTDLLVGMAGRAQQALAGGVTTIRDLGDRSGLAIRLRDAIDSGALQGPRILSAAAPITVAGGHCWFLGGEVDGESAIRQRVRHNAALGADVIKVMASGGQMTPESPPMWASQFSTDELRVVVEEAVAVGLPTAAHAHGVDAVVAAAEAGVTTIEHCTFLRAGGGGVDRRDAIAGLMAERGIYACSAMSTGWRAFLDRLGQDRAQQILSRFHWLDGHGVRLIPGTDAGLPGSVFHDFVGALGLYAYLGFPADRIIEMATVTSATGIGLGDHVGQISAGYAADLLIVEGDPLSNLDDLRHQRLILARGQVVPARPVLR